MSYCGSRVTSCVRWMLHFRHAWIYDGPQRGMLLLPCRPCSTLELYNMENVSIQGYKDSPLLLLLRSFLYRGSLLHGTCVHAFMMKVGLHDHLYLNNRLLAIYCEHRHPTKEANKLFNEMHIRDVVSWTTLILAHTKRGECEDALAMFDLMTLTSSGMMPNEFTLSAVLRCATLLGDINLGRRTHGWVIKLGFEHNGVLVSGLMDLYYKCDEHGDAARVFALADGESRDAVSWTIMISARSQAGKWVDVQRLYTSMIKGSVRPNVFTFTALLQAIGVCDCSGSNLFDCLGLPIHAQIIVWGIELNLILKTALAHMYMNSHKVRDALIVANQTSESDVALWTTLISGHNESGDHIGAASLFHVMEVEAGVRPNSFCFAVVLNVCSLTPAPCLGRQIHGRLVKEGILEHDNCIGNALVDMYAKCGGPDVLREVQRAFEAISFPDVVSWTTLISGLARHPDRHSGCSGSAVAAFSAYTRMRASGVEPNCFTLSTLLSCFCLWSDGQLAHAEQLHAYVLKTGSDAMDISVVNSLVHVYASFGRAEDAWYVSLNMPHRDVYTYTSLVKGLNEMSLPRKAILMETILLSMRSEGVTMDGSCLASFLSSCSGSTTMVGLGRQLHAYAVRSGLLHSWISVSNSLVDMYGKCGSLIAARCAFDEIRHPNVISWNCLISVLASHGRFSTALSAFEDMRLAGVAPDAITFLLVLHVCSHGKMVDIGMDYFDSMVELYGVAPLPEHYVCLVDMLGRAGRLEPANSIIESMPFDPDARIYKTLLSACKVHGDVALGEYAASRALQLDASDSAVYVLLASLYDDAGRMDLGNQTRLMSKLGKLRKNPGQSWMVVASSPTSSSVACNS